MKSRLIIIYILNCILLFSGCAYYNTFYNAKRFYGEAEKERKNRERTQVVELSPEEQEQMRRSGFGRGSELNRASTTEMQNYQRAIEKSSKVLEFYPKSKYVDDAIMLLGECFYYRREFSKALRKFEELEALYPNSEYIPRARLLMAKTYLGMEEFEEAETRLREYALNEKYDNELREQAKFELGTLYFEREKYELAAENFRETAEKSDDKLIRALSIYRLGECMIKLEDYAEAVRLFGRAVKISPNEDFNSQAYFKLGESQSLNGNYSAAIRTFSRLLSKEFDNKRIPRIKLQLAENLRLNNEPGEAIKWYENIIEEHPRTDAAARSYYALGQIEEFGNQDYRKAREHYDMVKSQFANSLVVPAANRRSSNIKQLLELEDEIARLEGREVFSDSTEAESGEEREERTRRDDAPINLGADGMWINYAGRDRPPPKTLADLTEDDLARAARLSQAQLAAISAADSAALPTAASKLDSAALAEQKAKEEADKKLQLSQKKLALAELLFFNFDKTDSALAIYQSVLEAAPDTATSVRAMYSLGYIHYNVLHDTSEGRKYLSQLIDFQPESPQALSARKILKLPVAQKVDSAYVYFTKAEQAIDEQQNIEKAFEYYDKIVEHYPESELVPKAIFAKGWHYEQLLHDKEKAAKEYKILLDQFPDSPFAKQIKPIMTPVEKQWAAEAAKQKAVEDSLAAVAKEQVASDSLRAAAGDSMTISLPDSVISETPVDTNQPAQRPPIMEQIPPGTTPTPVKDPSATEQLAPAPAAQSTPKPDSARPSPPQNRVEKPGQSKELKTANTTGEKP